MHGMARHGTARHGTERHGTHVDEQGSGLNIEVALLLEVKDLRTGITKDADVDDIALRRVCRESAPNITPYTTRQ